MPRTSSHNEQSKEQSKTIGLFPAAGHATRLSTSQADTTCSKEVVSVPDLNSPAGDDSTIAVGDYLVRAYAEAGINNIIIIRRPEKTDIAAHYGSRQFATLSLQHRLTQSTPGTPYTLLKAFDQFKNYRVAFGFPDIILQAPHLFGQLQIQLQDSNSDICLALFPAAHPANCDTVASDGARVTAIEIKNPESPYQFSWYCAMWQPRFSQFFYDFVQDTQAVKNCTGDLQELYMGHVFRAAMQGNFKVSQVTFKDGLALDIGRPEDLQRARAMRSV